MRMPLWCDGVTSPVDNEHAKSARGGAEEAEERSDGRGTRERERGRQAEQ